MKGKKYCALLCLALALTVTACSGNTDETSSERAIDSFPMDPATPTYPAFTDMNPWHISSVDVEEEYDQIEVYFPRQVYEPNAQYIVAQIVNHHGRYGFYFHETPYLEKWNEDHWTYVSLKEDPYHEIYDYDELVFCGTPDTKDNEFKSAAGINIAMMQNYRFDPGSYRMIIRVGPNNYYAYFEVEETKL